MQVIRGIVPRFCLAFPASIFYFHDLAPPNQLDNGHSVWKVTVAGLFERVSRLLSVVPHCYATCMVFSCISRQDWGYLTYHIAILILELAGMPYWDDLLKCLWLSN